MSLPTRPSVHAWKAWRPDTVNDFIEVVQDLIDTRQITQIALANELDISAQSIYRWRTKSNPWTSIRRENYEAAVAYLYELRLLPIAASGINEAEYLGVVSFMGQTHEQLREIEKNVCGHYRVHRWSNAKRGSILCGRLQISYNAKLQIVETEEFYRATLGSETVSWPRSGYFLGRGADGFSLFSRKHRSREAQIVHLRIATRRGEGANPLEVLKFEGIIFDMQNAAVYSTAIELLKVKTPVTDAEIRDFIPKTAEEKRIGDALKALLHFDGAIVEF